MVPGAKRPRKNISGDFKVRSAQRLLLSNWFTDLSLTDERGGDQASCCAPRAARFKSSFQKVGTRTSWCTGFKATSWRSGWQAECPSQRSGSQTTLRTPNSEGQSLTYIFQSLSNEFGVTTAALRYSVHSRFNYHYKVWTLTWHTL